MKTQERVFQAEGTASAKASRQRQCPNYLLTHRLLLNSRDQILLISTTSFLPCHRRWSVAWMEDQVKAACRPQMQADSDAVMRWERQLMVSFLFQLDPEGSQHHQLQRRDVPGRSPASSGPQILVSCPENEVWAQVLSTSVGPQSHQKGRTHGSSLLFLPRNAQRQSVSSCAAS